MDGALNDLVLLVLVQFAAIIKVNLVEAVGLDEGVGFLHVEADGEDPGEGEVGILDVFPVDLLIHVEQVGVLELLNGLLGDHRDPVVHP